MIPVFTRIIAVSIVCLATLIGLAMPLPASPNSESVLVFAFENQTDDRNIDWIGAGLSELVVDRLIAMSGRLLTNAWAFLNPWLSLAPPQ
jgi:small neutral amino acid transporter SnatA (MarC family)